MHLHPVVSNNVRAVGYSPEARVLRVQFRSGGVFDYHGVGRGLFEQMLCPHPWRRVGRLVMAHGGTKVA
jgi:hypothetical protein